MDVDLRAMFDVPMLVLLSQNADYHYEARRKADDTLRDMARDAYHAGGVVPFELAAWALARAGGVLAEPTQDRGRPPKSPACNLRNLLIVRFVKVLRADLGLKREPAIDRVAHALEIGRDHVESILKNRRILSP